MDALNLKCGQCGHINELPANWRQPVAFCVMCGHKIPVPRLEDPPAGAAADLGSDEEAGFAEQARKSEGRKISVTCSKCGKTVTVSARVAGRKARCKACDAPMDIPYPDDLEQQELPRPRNGARETGLDLVAPGEMPTSARASASPGDLESTLDLLPEPIQYASDDEGTHEPLPVVIPLSQHAPTAKPHRLPHKRHADAAGLAPQGAADQAPAAQAGAEQPPLEPSPNLAGLTDALPQATQVFLAEAGELASAVKDFKADKEATMERRRRAARMRSVMYLVVGILLCSALTGLAMMYWPTLFPERTPSTEIANTPVNSGKVEPKSPADPKITQVPVVPSVVPTTGVDTTTVPVAPPVVPQPRCNIVTLVTATLGPDGYYPAPLGSIYWKMTAEIKAGTDPIAFNAMGKDVQLALADKMVDSLGIVANSPARGGALPRLARQEAVSIKPGQSRKITLLFQVPVGTSQGEVVIGKQRWPFRVKPGDEPIPPDNLAGTFVEVPPRNLQPMLSDPVMAAIQSAGKQELAVRSNGSDLDVGLLQAQVYGRAKPVGPDVYNVGLTYGDHKLAANLRFAEGGRIAILYLADRPFHQMTFINPAVPRQPPPTPAASAPAASQPTTAEETADPPPAEPHRPRREPPTVTIPKGPPDRDRATDLPRGKSIFD